MAFGLGLRGVLLVLPPIVTPDSEGRYEPLARNLAAGHGFSSAAAPPYTADGSTQPGYPLFLAAIQGLAGERRPLVVLAQMVLELLVLLCIWRLAQRLELPPVARTATLVLALLCPVLPVIARAIWSEMLATSLLTATCLAWLDAVRTFQYKWWLASGVGSGACLLVRADLLPAVGLLASVALCFAWRRAGARSLACLGIAAVGGGVLVGAWAARNHGELGRLQPLGGYVSQLDDPYVTWLSTWTDDLADMAPYWWYVGQPGYPSTYPEAKVIDAGERARANAILAAGPPAFSRAEARREFAALTVKARSERPLRTFFIVPLRRLVAVWLDFTSYIRYPLVRRIATAAWGALLLAALVGITIGVRRHPDAGLLLTAMIAGRCVLPLFIGIACEPRYAVEGLPAVFLLTGFVLAPLGHADGAGHVTDDSAMQRPRRPPAPGP